MVLHRLQLYLNWLIRIAGREENITNDSGQRRSRTFLSIRGLCYLCSGTPFLIGNIVNSASGVPNPARSRNIQMVRPHYNRNETWLTHQRVTRLLEDVLVEASTDPHLPRIITRVSTNSYTACDFNELHRSGAVEGFHFPAWFSKLPQLLGNMIGKGIGLSVPIYDVILQVPCIHISKW